MAQWVKRLPRKRKDPSSSPELDELGAHLNSQHLGGENFQGSLTSSLKMLLQKPRWTLSAEGHQKFTSGLTHTHMCTHVYTHTHTYTIYNLFGKINEAVQKLVKVGLQGSGADDLCTPP